MIWTPFAILLLLWQVDRLRHFTPKVHRRIRGAGAPVRPVLSRKEDRVPTLGLLIEPNIR